MLEKPVMLIPSSQTGDIRINNGTKVERNRESWEQNRLPLLAHTSSDRSSDPIRQMFFQCFHHWSPSPSAAPLSIGHQDLARVRLQTRVPQ